MATEDNDASKSNNKAAKEVTLLPPPLKTTSATNNVSAATQQKKDAASSSKKISEPVVIDDRDLPSSTPAPPPLNVPIVTHSSKPIEGTVYFERSLVVVQAYVIEFVSLFLFSK